MGHFGYILEGRFEIEFDSGTEIFEAGDGVFIPDGKEHRHRAKALGDIVRALFVEDI
jgi:quercetin dioxygenase-like cupin family protein